MIYSLEDVLNSIFQRQARDIAHRLVGAEIFDKNRMPDLTHWIRAVAEASKPFLLHYWREGMRHQQAISKKGVMRSGDKYMHVPERSLRRTSSNLSKVYVAKAGSKSSLRSSGSAKRNAPGLTSSTVYNGSLFQSKVSDAVDAAAFDFARSTLETATDTLEVSVKRLRALLKNGELNRANAVGELAKEVEKIFADPFRAKRIAATERVRMVNGAKVMVAKDSGTVEYKIWRATGNCCPMCCDMDGKRVKLNESFAELGGRYGSMHYAPAHPFCACDVEFE